MRYFQRHHRGEESDNHDPMAGVANLFDVGLVFIVGLLLALFGVLHLEEFFKEDSALTITSRTASGELQIITKKGRKIEAMKVSKEKTKGRGQRLGTAFRLEDGSMIYVPED